MSAENVPDGYMINGLGHLVPMANIKPIDLARDELVLEIVSNARAVQAELASFKARTLDDISAFVDLSAEQYGVHLGGKKGNVTLSSFDGRLKIQLSVANRLQFDERLKAAKSLVDACIHAWTQDSRTEIKALVEHAFQTDQEGKINTGRILSLMRLDISDAQWKRAMEALKDSLQVVSTSTYIRIYERLGGADKYVQIPLDIAAI